MYEFRPVLPRIERMRVAVRDRVIVADAEKDALKLEALKHQGERLDLQEDGTSH